MKTSTAPIVIPLALAAVALLVAVLWPRAADSPAAPPRTESTKERFETEIHLPADLGTMATDRLDSQGRRIRVRCSTCHGGDVPDGGAVDGATPVHQGLTLAHGGVSCLSCHDQNNRDVLRLADGTPLAFAQVMDLCRQCHGPQSRDYHNGSHGGMTGHWDLTQGPRLRNGCVHCHDAHAPAIGQVQPVAMPRDRGLVQSMTHNKEAH